MAAFIEVLPVQLAAREFAIRAHEGQFRRYPLPDGTRAPYVEHCKRVAFSVAEVGLDPQAVAAAYLHDVKEDCGTHHEVLVNNFGHSVADAVDLLTNTKNPLLRRHVRKKLERIRLGEAPSAVQSIKCADILDNGPSILLHDQALARIWFPEADALLGVLELAHSQLWSPARAMVSDGLRSLGMKPTKSRDGL